MKIGVLGPPGVGKTKFARQLAKRFGLKLVDGYVQRLQRSTGLALGPWSTYSENFMIAGVRQAAEERVSKIDTITTGTIADTITYAMVKTDVALHSSRAAAQENYTVAQGAIQGLSMWYTETWDYHISFYLPYDASQKANSMAWGKALDAAYPHVLESFQVPFVYTLNGPPSDRVKLAQEILTLAQSLTQDDVDTSNPTAVVE